MCGENKQASVGKIKCVYHCLRITDNERIATTTSSYITTILAALFLLYRNKLI